ncbi:hypothetical protein ACU686_40820 [Yinghuangia aomiensis]
MDEGGKLVFGADVLGAPYEAATIRLRDDAEGEAVATLVRHRAETPTGRAVLYVHGFNDYFFQRHLADFHIAQGFDFYALDLRSYEAFAAPAPHSRVHRRPGPLRRGVGRRGPAHPGRRRARHAGRERPFDGRSDRRAVGASPGRPRDRRPRWC